MRSYRRNFFCNLLIFILAATINITARRMSCKNKIPLGPNNAACLTEKPVIVFDLVNVLFKESYTGFAQKIGYGTLTSYALTHWKNPGHRCLDMLENISEQDSQKPDQIIALHDRKMPQCIVELYQGNKTCLETKNALISGIEELDKKNFFTSGKEKSLMHSIITVTFDPNSIHHITEPVKQMVTVAQKLKQNGYSLYAVGNMPQEFYVLLEKHYPSVISLFNGVVISSQIKNVKPNKSMFEHLTTTYNLNPQLCIMIDSGKDSVTAAQSFGMRALLYEKPSVTIGYLKKQGIRI